MQLQFGSESLVGEGTFGTVYRVVAGPYGELVAVKQLKPNSNEEYRRRFLREVRMQAPLRHKHIVPILGYELDVQQPYFFMPYAESNLREYLKYHYGEEHLWIFRQIAEGVGFAHENGIIHRDLKPENVLLLAEDDGTLYAAVSDFGLGRMQTRDTTTLTVTNAVLGTWAYMAPEQLRDAKEVDERCDIYALGKLLYEILTQDIPYPDIQFNLLPDKYSYIVHRACESRPEQRYANVRDMLAALDLVSDDRRAATASAEKIRELLQLTLSEQYDTETVRTLTRLFRENTKDTTVLTDLLPQIPPHILRLMIENDYSTTVEIVKSYDVAISGELPYSYCDTSASFYETLFIESTTYELRTIVLNRLPQMAVMHNRFYVGRVFARIVQGLNDISLIYFVRDNLRENRSAGAWIREYLDSRRTPPEILEALPE